LCDETDGGKFVIPAHNPKTWIFRQERHAAKAKSCNDNVLERGKKFQKYCFSHNSLIFVLLICWATEPTRVGGLTTVTGCKIVSFFEQGELK
jgi:hypothetical protein